ncbi:metalloendoproteinase 4-MMP-like [Dendronephthya gigantea]|uniref:metalloendoproteinase 4-MMP-like n=1 Tax=Dendronephthya gigantea TaxID=151771 RepID=UPI00106A3691|nr:metalloendoproteinase 4-MMP-like [Dendronephthya gigantea]
MKRSGCLYIAILCLCFVSVQSKSWKNKDKADKGDNGKGWKVGHWKKFLKQYGYTTSEKISPHEIKNAIVKFRILYQFDNTVTDDDLVKFITINRRCGNKDRTGKKSKKNKGKRRVRRYDLNPAWTTKSIKYAIEKYSSSGLTVQQQNDIAAEAFQLWEDSVPQLDFTQSSESEAHIKIRFEKGSHGCAQDFDGKDGIIAHAYLPEDGRIHLDDAEPFTVQSDKDVSLKLVLVHEIGHALGLGHSFVKGAMMHPVYRENTSEGTLHEDDINGMRMLYAPETAADPNCVDQDPSLCAFYKNQGYCVPDFADVMIETCPYTCNLCQ